MNQKRITENLIPESSEVPEKGDTIRTVKMQMEGKVERISQSRAGYDEVFFRIADGRLMKTPLDNVTVVEKIMGQESAMEDATDDISLEDILSEVVEKYRVDELSVGKLKAFQQQVKSPERMRSASLGQLKRDVEGNTRAKTKIATKSGQQIPDKSQFKEQQTDEAFDKNAFADLLGKQHAEKPVAKKKDTVDIPSNNWIIRYRPAATPKDKVVWQVMDKKYNIKQKGTALSDKDAVADAQEWIDSGGGESGTSTKRVTIDFNVNFAREFAPEGETFYAKIEKYGTGTALQVSTTHHEGYKKSHIRNQKNKITGTTTKLPMIPMSPTEANAAGLVANGRYSLGDKEDMGQDTMLFPLKYEGKTQSKTDTVRLNRPGITVATERTDVDEAIDPWHGYTPDDKKANALAKAPKTTMQGNEDVPFDQLVKDSIKTHGLKWAFDYYVRKNGLPPRQFQIFAGLTVKPKNNAPAPTAPNTPAKEPEQQPEKQSWWKKLRGKLPFEE